MKKDEFGPIIEDYIATHDGVSVADIREAVGCSPQRVYGWVQRNRHRLRAVGRTEHGAVRYVLRGIEDTEPASSGGGVQIGAIVTVRSMRFESGQLLIGLEADDGTELTATVLAG